MDGTLIDSANFHWITWRDSLAELGFALTPEIFRSWFGSRNDRILRLMFPDMSDSEVKRVGDLKEARYRALVRKDGIELLPGVAMWLERLHEAGWRQAVASSAPPANIEVLIEVLKLGDILQATVSAEEVPHGKPAPDVFLRAAEKLGVDARRSIVVEDAAVGVEAGRRGGMRTIGITGVHGPLDADIVVASMTELPPDAFDSLVAAS
jgi:HAD superfamily hydrolase (TIGR01509 family)